MGHGAGRAWERRAPVKALERAGWGAARQRGNHVRMKHPGRRASLTVPLHRELKRGTLSGILNDAEPQ